MEASEDGLFLVSKVDLFWGGGGRGKKSTKNMTEDRLRGLLNANQDLLILFSVSSVM
jgi:hypothetical protein